MFSVRYSAPRSACVFANSWYPRTSRAFHAFAARANEWLINSPISLNGARLRDAGAFIAALLILHHTLAARLGRRRVIPAQQRIRPARRPAQGLPLNHRHMRQQLPLAPFVFGAIVCT